MEYLLYISRFLYRIRWWLILGTIFFTLLAYWLTRNLPKTYNVEATVYTGVVSGYSLDQGNSRMDWAATQNAIDNLINIMRSESTLQNVSLRLYARNMIHGNLERDNEYIKTSNFQWMYNHVKNSPQGKEILALIDKSSEDKTVENLKSFIRPSKDNYLYGLFQYNHKHYSYGALKNIRISRRDASDLLNVAYSSDDPGIAYNTLQILMEEFVNEYRAIRYGETDKVIAYFLGELRRIGGELETEEDGLTAYNVENRIISYGDETKEIASINKEFELREQDVMLAYNSSKVMLEEIEKQMDANMRQLLNNLQFINKLKEASELTGKISEQETIASSSTALNEDKAKLDVIRKDLSAITDRYISGKYTKEGVNKTTIVEQWLDLTLKFEKAKSDLNVVMESRRMLDDKYRFFAPIGSTIKRMERKIGFAESSYLSTLKSYHDALMRKKNLEMTSATIKVLNPPSYPINPQPTNRKKIVMAACVGSFLFILGFFLLVELLDRTLRDSIRSRRLTRMKIMGAFPAPARFKFRQYNQNCEDLATRHMSSSILQYFTNRKEGMPYIVNFISTEAGEGKTHLTNELVKYWDSIGLKVKRLSWNNIEDFNPESRKYMLANSMTDLYTPSNEDIIVVEHQDLKSRNIPDELLQEANINVLVARADRGWKETDKILLEKVKTQVGNTPICLYLNKAERDVVQDYTGMLPPYTFIREQIYRLSQLALTEKTASYFQKKDSNEDEE